MHKSEFQEMQAQIKIQLLSQFNPNSKLIYKNFLNLQMESSSQEFDKDFILKDDEKKKAREFNKKVVEEFVKLDPSRTRMSYYTDINNTTRFLVAREFKEPKAMEMWKKWREWRLTYKVDDIKEDEIASELKSGKAYWFGHDKLGHPCLHIIIRRHIPKESSPEGMIRFGVYLIEKGIKLMDEAGVSKMVVIWDRNGFSKSKNYDSRMLGLMKQLIGILQDFYAERLQILYILNVNWFFKAVFAIIKPFLAEKSKKKIKILGKTEELLQYFDKDQLLLEHCGTSNFVYRWPPDAEPVKDNGANVEDDDDKIEDLDDLGVEFKGLDPTTIGDQRHILIKMHI